MAMTMGSASSAALVQLVDDVRKQEPELIARQLPFQVRAASLFFHCTVRLPRLLTEAIIVGVEVMEQGEGFLVVGDVCGEESGHVHFEVESEEVKQPADLVAAVATVAGRLGQRVDDVLKALRASEEVCAIG